jgi:hypothetical protein
MEYRRGRISQEYRRWGYTGSVAELETRIDCWVSHWNDNPEPFVWTKPADEILDKVARGQATLDRITKSATHH